MCFLVNKVSECVLLVHVCNDVFNYSPTCTSILCIIIIMYTMYLYMYIIFQVHILLCDYNCGHVSV